MIRAAGHEIGHHAWVHENPAMLTPEQERQVLERGLEALDRIAGARPLACLGQQPGDGVAASGIWL
jgi:peptidoglycan/xylan/chitin deacetylase (PgdA/CDA1 family)